MPILSMFYGIIIRMQSEKGGKHHVPHIHCVYGDQEAVLALDGTLIEGNLPSNKMKLVQDKEKDTPTSHFRYIAGNYFLDYDEALGYLSNFNELLRNRLAK